MALTLTQSVTAVGVNGYASFLASGGVEPYLYTRDVSGAGGTININTGVYTAPTVAQSDPRRAYDTIRVTDDTGAIATARILVGNALLLFCQIIEREMALPDGSVYLWDQKINAPKDDRLFVVVSTAMCKPFGNINRIASATGGMESAQFVSMYALLNLDIISRGPAARDRKEEIILALGSTYAQQQQEANAFLIGKLPPSSGFVNLSQLDASAIPYRFRISCAIQYAVSKARPVDYFDEFEPVDPVIDN